MLPCAILYYNDAIMKISRFKHLNFTFILIKRKCIHACRQRIASLEAEVNKQKMKVKLYEAMLKKSKEETKRMRCYLEVSYVGQEFMRR